MGCVHPRPEGRSGTASRNRSTGATLRERSAAGTPNRPSGASGALESEAGAPSESSWPDPRYWGLRCIGAGRWVPQLPFVLRGDWQGSSWPRGVRAVAAEADKKDRLTRCAGVDGVDGEGRRLDQREFEETTRALHTLASAQMGWYRNRGGRYRRDLLGILAPQFEQFGLPSDHGIKLLVAKNGQSWWAWRRTISGWCFAIGAADPPPDQWLFDGPEPHKGFPGKDQA